jgi:malate dehydrogenase (oxaloacetate-decarboxylating)
MEAIDRRDILNEAVGDEEEVEVPLAGHLLLERPTFNKGTAFTADERRAFGLLGLLPPREETLAEQVTRAYKAYARKDDDLERHIYLRQLQDENTTLFYALLLDHLAEMMPIIYTPTVGRACQEFSHIYRRPRGLFLAYPDRDAIDAMLGNADLPEVSAIVVSDGERILGLGDQGAGGMGIPIGKLSLYSACGGVHPNATLPILLDVGTDNEERLNDPLYVGWRHERIRGQEYDDFVDAFVRAVRRKFPHVLLQWEDFAGSNAARLLERYRDQLCTFNDDIQGTAAVTVGTLLAASAAARSRLRDQTVAFLGAGSAGCGIAEQMVAAMVEEGLPEPDARDRFFMVDRPGLLHDGMADLRPAQRKLAQPRDKVLAWAGPGGTIDLRAVVENARPTILIGVSGQGGAFTEDVVRAMAGYAPRPIVFPLSNPTSKAEAKPADLLAWTEGRAVVATGSPFDPVKLGGKTYPIAQCNNSYIFPGMGLGLIASKATQVPDALFMAAARALADASPAKADPAAPLLPPLADSRKVSRSIAVAVAEAARRAGVAGVADSEDLAALVDAKTWVPRYPRMRPK